MSLLSRFVAWLRSLSGRFVGWLWHRLDPPRRTAWSEFVELDPDKGTGYRICACGTKHANPGPNQCTACDRAPKPKRSRVVPLRRAG